MHGTVNVKFDGTVCFTRVGLTMARKWAETSYTGSVVVLRKTEY